MNMVVKVSAFSLLFFPKEIEYSFVLKGDKPAIFNNQSVLLCLYTDVNSNAIASRAM